MRYGEITEWAPFECDGVAYEWQAIATEARTRGSRDPVILIAVRRPGSPKPGAGKVFPIHTKPTAEHARETVRFFQAHRVEI